MGRASRTTLFVALVTPTFDRDTVAAEYALRPSEVESSIKYLAGLGLIEKAGTLRSRGRGRRLATYRLVPRRELDAWQIYGSMDDDGPENRIASTRARTSPSQKRHAHEDKAVDMLRTLAGATQTRGAGQLSLAFSSAALSLSRSRFMRDLPLDILRRKATPAERGGILEASREATPLEPTVVAMESWLDEFEQEMLQWQLSNPDTDADASIRSFSEGTEDFVLLAGATREDVDAAIREALGPNSRASPGAWVYVRDRVMNVLRGIRELDLSGLAR